MASPTELQAVSLTFGDLVWIVGTGFVIVSTVVTASMWLHKSFRDVQRAIDDVKSGLGVQSTKALAAAELNDTRLNQHSERTSAIESRVVELERWRLKHVEDHR